MGRVIILEGPDGTGKTTLAKQIAANFGYEYVHNGEPKSEDMLKEYATQLYDAINDEDEDYVFDRLHIGERIYGPLLRQRDRLSHQGEILMNRLIKANNVSLVFCFPTYEVAYANWKQRHATELVKDHEQYEKIYEEYKQRANSKGYAFSYTYDYKKIDLDLAVQTLHEWRRTLPTLPAGVIGDPRSRYLFVGDIANQTHLDLPFFATTASSEYLNECLSDAGFAEEQIALTNAKYLSEINRNLREIWEAMGKPRVCALGSKAWHALTVQKVPCVKVHHPAFWKRFHAAERHTYIQALREAMIS